MKPHRHTSLVIDSTGIPVLNMTTTMPLTMEQAHAIFPAMKHRESNCIEAVNCDHPTSQHRFGSAFKATSDSAEFKFIIGVNTIVCDIPFAKFSHGDKSIYGWSRNGISKKVPFIISQPRSFYSFVIIDREGKPWCFTIHMQEGLYPFISTWQFPNIDPGGKACLGDCGYDTYKAMLSPECAMGELSKWFDAKWNHDWAYDRFYAAARMFPFSLSDGKLIQVLPDPNYRFDVAGLCSFTFSKILLNEITSRIGADHISIESSNDLDVIWNRVASINSPEDAENLRKIIDDIFQSNVEETRSIELEPLTEGTLTFEEAFPTTSPQAPAQGDDRVAQAAAHADTQDIDAIFGPPDDTGEPDDNNNQAL